MRKFSYVSSDGRERGILYAEDLHSAMRTLLEDRIGKPDKTFKFYEQLEDGGKKELDTEKFKKMLEKAPEVDIFSELSESDKMMAEMDAAIAIAFRRARIARDMEADDLAELLGVSRFTVDKIEAGDYSFKLHALCKYAEKLGLKVSLSIKDTKFDDSLELLG